MDTNDEIRKVEMALPQLICSNDTLGRAYRAYRRSSDKPTFARSVVTALSELPPHLNTTVAAQAQIEMWLMENDILSSDEVNTLRADIAAKRTTLQKVSEERGRTAKYLEGTTLAS